MRSINREFVIVFLAILVLNFAPVSIFENLISVEGVVNYTNVERELAGLDKLVSNENLNTAAEHRALDMFAHQYFAHGTPFGSRPADFAEAFDYDYGFLGENIALGRYTSESVVQAWMDSEGHRTNILSSSFEDIGVESVRGMFEGQDTLIVVQLFGKER